MTTVKKNIVIVSVGTRGDIDPFIVLGVGLLKRGYKVYCVSDPHYENLIESSGLIFINGTPQNNYTIFVNDPNSCNPKQCLRSVFKHLSYGTMQTSYEALTQFDPATTIIIASRLMFGARLASEAMKFKLILIALQPVTINNLQTSLVSENLITHTKKWLQHKIRQLIYRCLLRPKMLAKINPVRNKLGLEQLNTDIFKWLFANEINLGLYPAWFDSSMELSIKPIGFIHSQNRFDTKLPPEVMEFLAAGSPPLLATFGTGMKQCAQLLNTALLIARKLNRRIILLTSFTDQVPSLQANRELHLSYANLNQLLPHLTGVIHHGGIGTMALTLSHGLPQLIVPLLFDQPDNAQRLSQLGCAKTIAPDCFNINDGSIIVESMLNDQQLLDRCKKYSHKINFQATENLVLDLIEQQCIQF